MPNGALGSRIQGVARMSGQERGLWVRLISREALRQYMEFRGETNASLGRKAGVSKAIVGHLRSGQRVTCTGRTAHAIERALNAPPSSLFLAAMTNAQSGTSHSGRVSA